MYYWCVFGCMYLFTFVTLVYSTLFFFKVL